MGTEQGVLYRDHGWLKHDRGYREGHGVKEDRKTRHQQRVLLQEA